MLAVSLSLVLVVILLLTSMTVGFHNRNINSYISISRSNTRIFMTTNVDVAVIGGGIAGNINSIIIIVSSIIIILTLIIGSTISWLLQEREGLKVALIDPRANTPGSWYPNYGEWRYYNYYYLYYQKTNIIIIEMNGMH